MSNEMEDRTSGPDLIGLLSRPLPERPRKTTRNKSGKLVLGRDSTRILTERQSHLLHLQQPALCRDFLISDVMKCCGLNLLIFQLLQEELYTHTHTHTHTHTPKTLEARRNTGGNLCVCVRARGPRFVYNSCVS
jgi:hypothetical protein